MTKILMPQLGESVTEGTIIRWLKNVGDTVSKYEAICEVETDKVTAEVPSTVSGTLTEIVVEEGTTVAVGELICHIQAEGEVATDEEQERAAVEITEKQQLAQNTPDHKKNQEKQSVAGKRNNNGKIRYSPAVMRLAQEHDIDLSLLEGTGVEGRITRKDVMKYIEEQKNQAEQADTSHAIQLTEATQPSFQQPPTIQKQPSQTTAFPMIEDGDQVMEISQVRKTIAKRMVQSKHEAPHAWMTVEADVTELVNYRNKIKEGFKKEEGFSITYLPFFIKAVVEAIKEFPMINSVWAEDKIILKKRINISIAVATDDALYVPVIKDADKKSIYGIAKEIDDLASKTRAGKLTMEDLQGGTFTVNNTGSFGSVLSAPILNHPQAGIITMESIIKKPVVINDMIAIRSMVNLCMSLDHRILDGLVTGRFVQKVRENLVNMGKQEVSIY